MTTTELEVIAVGKLNRARLLLTESTDIFTEIGCDEQAVKLRHPLDALNDVADDIVDGLPNPRIPVGGLDLS